MFRIKASHLPFLILFLFALIFSFYKLDNFYQLNYDQERDYQVVQKILSGDLTLIGPQAVSTAGFYLAPWYYYLLVPFFVLFNGHPLYAAYLTGLVHLLTTLALFLFLKKHTKHDLIALASSLLYASTLHRTAWNVMFIPLLFILFLNLLLRSRQTPKSFSLLLFLVSLGIHFHFQFVLLAPFLGIYLLLNRSKLPSLRSKNLALYFIALLIPLLPLIAFDLRHDFINSRSFLNFFGSALTTSSNLPYLQLLRFSARNIIRETSLYTPLPLNLDYIFLPLAYIGSLIVVLRKKRSLLPLALFPVISLFALSLYSPPTWPEYYHLLAVLSFIVLVSYLIASSPHLIKSLYFIFVLAALVTSLQYLHTYTNSDGYDSRQAVIKYILDSSSPLQPNIRYHFPPGQGLGFTPIRDYLSTQYDLTDQYSNTQFDVFFTSSPPPALPTSTDQVSFGVYTVSLSSTIDK